MKELLFYDIEVFEYDSLVVFKNIEGNTVAHYWNNEENKNNGFQHVNDLISDKTLVGYNNYHYDDLVLCAMKTGLPQSTIKRVNDDIIFGNSSHVKDYAIKQRGWIL